MANGPADVTKMGRSQFTMPGRYAVTLECADDMTANERTMLDAWFATEVSLLQRNEPGFTAADALQWECEALGIDPATQGANDV